jgi:uncharacterized protein (DUF1800 family)
MNHPSSISHHILAAHRFGFGASESDVLKIRDNAKAWLASQIESTTADTALYTQCFGNLPNSDKAAGVFPSLLRRAGLMGGAAGLVRSIFASNKPDNDDATQSRSTNSVSSAMPDGENRALTRMLPYLTSELEGRIHHAVKTPAPFLDRLVWFWSNHLTVSAKRIGLVALVGPYEREAIRPNVLGKFENLLLAALRHPAMQIYLDNFRSVGPNTSAVGTGYGMQRRTGINENLAREVLELHTLGERTVYGQQDVNELALALTGWGLGEGGKFRFDNNAHEPGMRTLLGKEYSQDGHLQAEKMLRDLATHPVTAKHLSYKLLRHFSGVKPYKSDVEQLAKTYMQCGGELHTVLLSMLDMPCVWKVEGLRRVKHADEFLVSAWRTLDSTPPDGQKIYEQLKAFGQVPWWATSPAGWPDQSFDELGPDALLARIDWANSFGERAGALKDARKLAQQRFGSLLSDLTSQEIQRAGSGAQAVTLMLTSPEFLRV